MTGLHHMLVHFPVALWSLATLLMVLTALGRNPGWLHRALPPLLLLGLVAGVSAALTGIFAWAPEAILASPLGRNKLAFGLWSLAWWGALWWLHHRHGDALYAGGRRWLPPVLALTGMVLLAITGTLGGLLAGVTAGIPELLRSIGFEAYTTIIQPWWSLLVLAAVVAALAALTRRV